MLSIRLQRRGRKHQPSYRLVVAERRSKRDGPPVEDLGSYNPFSKEQTFKAERVKYWLGVGAQPTGTAHNLLVACGVIEGPKVAVRIRKRKKIADEGETAVVTPTGEETSTIPTPDEAIAESVPETEASSDKAAMEEKSTNEDVAMAGEDEKEGKKEEKPAAAEEIAPPREENAPAETREENKAPAETKN